MTISTKKLLATTGFCSLGLFLSGCTYTHYTIYSVPRGAQVYVDGQLKGVTPYTAYLPDPVNSELIIKKEGYQDYKKTLQSQLIPPLYNFYLVPGESSLQRNKISDRGYVRVIQLKHPGGKDIEILKQSIAKGNAVRLAVVPGEISNSILTDPVSLEQWRNGVKSQLLSEEENRFLHHFSGNINFSLVDRDRVESLLHELKFEASGVVSEEARSQLGKLLGVTHLQIINLSRFNLNDVISYRLIEVETGSVLSSYSFDSASF